MEHTAIPWTASYLCIYSGDDEQVATVDRSDFPDDIALANAAFIVRAVNSHTKLLAALEKYEAIHGHSGKCATTDKGCVSEQARDAIQEAKK